MAKKSKPIEPVSVVVDRAFTFEPAPGMTRTLPAGWRGTVAASVAAALEALGHGRGVADAARALDAPTVDGDAADGTPAAETGNDAG